MNNERVYKMKVSSVYPLYIQKAARKGRTKDEVDEAIQWLTGYDKQGFQSQLDKPTRISRPFLQRPRKSTRAPQKSSESSAVTVLKKLMTRLCRKSAGWTSWWMNLQKEKRWRRF